MAKQSNSNHALVIVGSVIIGIVLVVIIAAIAIMFFVLAPFTGDIKIDPIFPEADNSAANKAITQQAIDQKNPELCNSIKGSTTETYPLPPINGEPQNGSSTFNQEKYQQRCKQQAVAGQPYVY